MPANRFRDLRREAGYIYVLQVLRGEEPGNKRQALGTNAVDETMNPFQPQRRRVLRRPAFEAKELATGGNLPDRTTAEPRASELRKLNRRATTGKVAKSGGSSQVERHTRSVAEFARIQ